MREMQKKLIEAFEMGSFVFNADGTGYLDPQQMMVLQKARMDFGAKCQDVALQYLKLHANPIAAKTAAKSDIQRFQSMTSPPEVGEDISPYFDFLQSEIGVWIDRESGKSEWKRSVTRFLLAVPNVFRMAALSLVAVMIGLAVWDVVR